MAAKQAMYKVYRTFRLFTRHADIDAVQLPTYLLNRRLLRVVEFNFLMPVICFFVISRMYLECTNQSHSRLENLPMSGLAG